MMEHRVRSLPVLDGATNTLLGVLSVDDMALLRATRARAGKVLRFTSDEAHQAPAERIMQAKP